MPNSSTAAQKTFFLHIVKTAGTTFRGILKSAYGESFHFCANPTIAGIEQAAAKSKCIEFHSYVHNGELVHPLAQLEENNRWDLLERQNIFTMLREPLDQTLSFYSHMQRTRAHGEPLHRRYGVEFPDTLEKFLATPSGFNTQVSFLAGKIPVVPGQELTQHDLTRAKDLLTRFRVHVGLMERFTDSANIFARVTGKRVVSDLLKAQNGNPHRLTLHELSQKVKDQIREQSAMDIELYEFGKHLFMEDLAAWQPPKQYFFLREAFRMLRHVSPAESFSAPAS